MSDWFGAGWATIGTVVVGTAAMYASTLAAVRIAGRRTLAEISAFDAVVTVAIGSLLASTAVTKDPSVTQGLTALLTLLAMQMAIAAVRRHLPASRRLLDFPPRVVFADGEARVEGGPLGLQLTMDELRSALRQRGHFDLSSVAVVVVEPNGQLSVASAADGEGAETLQDAVRRGARRAQ